MRAILIGVLLSASVAFAGVEEAAFTVDMTGSRFVSQSVNELDDDHYGEPIAVRLDGELGFSFIVNVKASSPKVACSYDVIESTSGGTKLKIETSLEANDGEACSYTFVRGSKEATLSIYSEGT